MNNNTKVADEMVAGLHKLAENDAHHKFFTWASERINDATATSIDVVMVKAGLDRKGAREFVKALEALGCGTVFSGRRGAKSRIVWDRSLKSIGHAAITKAVATVEPLDPELKADAVDLREDGVLDVPPSLTIFEAKKRLAETFGVTPDAIEIIVRA